MNPQPAVGEDCPHLRRTHGIRMVEPSLLICRRKFQQLTSYPRSTHSANSDKEMN